MAHAYEQKFVGILFEVSRHFFVWKTFYPFSAIDFSYREFHLSEQKLLNSYLYERNDALTSVINAAVQFDNNRPAMDLIDELR